MPQHHASSKSKPSKKENEPRTSEPGTNEPRTNPSNATPSSKQHGAPQHDAPRQAGELASSKANTHISDKGNTPQDATDAEDPLAAKRRRQKRRLAEAALEADESDIDTGDDKDGQHNSTNSNKTYVSLPLEQLCSHPPPPFACFFLCTHANVAHNWLQCVVFIHVPSALHYPLLLNTT